MLEYDNNLVLPLFSKPMKDIPGEYKEKAMSICGISIYIWERTVNRKYNNILE